MLSAGIISTSHHKKGAGMKLGNKTERQKQGEEGKGGRE